MNLEDILGQWELDCVINENQLSDSSMRTAILHSKYINVLVDTKLKKCKIEADFKTLKRAKYRYYRGEMSRSELQQFGWEQYQYVKPLKNEMEDILKSDEDLSKIQLKIDFIDTMIFALESILNQIKARDWQIRNIIEFKKFMAGN